MSLDEHMSKTLTNLRKKRGVVKASLTRFHTFVNNFNPREDAITLLEFRQEELPTINRKFDEIQTEIELIDDSDEVEKERENFESFYYAVRSQMQEIINLEKSHNLSLQNTSINTTIPIQRARLAPIALPQFNGNILDWESFFDCFKALVHDEESYPVSQKFSYLRSTLSGPALDIIKTLPMTEANYAVAIKRLQKRYDNKSLVIQSHIRSILDCPSVEYASSGELQNLHSLITTHVAALEVMKQPIKHWDAWLVTVILRKLDQQTIQEWQLTRTHTELPTYTELEEFLANRCVAFECSGTWSGNSENNKSKNLSNGTNTRKGNAGYSTKKVLIVSEDREEKCKLCNGSHKLFFCDEFRKFSVDRRMTFVRENGLCFNCLSPYHRIYDCKSKSTYQNCKKRHNSLLHCPIEKEGGASSEESSDEQEGGGDVEASNTASIPPVLAVRGQEGHAFLSTAIITVADSRGCQRKYRAILDSGSQLNFVSRRLINTLQLSPEKLDKPLRRVGNINLKASVVISIQVASRVHQYVKELFCYVLPVIIDGIPTCNVPKGGWKIPEEYSSVLNDPDFYKGGPVDLLIGSGAFYDTLLFERVHLAGSGLSLQNTEFGWIMTGELSSTCVLATASVGEKLEEDWVTLRKNDDDIYGRLSRSNMKSLEDQEAVEHFLLTARRLPDGRFALRLPLKADINQLGDTYSMARSRFFNVERKLLGNDFLREEYLKFMNEYLKMGHMQLVTENEIPKQVCYLPHHAVIKHSSLMTKVRVVFDASAKSTSGKSLNDVLLCGPCIQDDVFTILCRFRQHLYVITADVEKMYRQVAVAEEDCNLQRILWRASPSEGLQSYRLLTVTYGTAPASFMATQCLASLAEEYKDRSPMAARAISKDFYMDDLLTGSDEEQECLKLQQDIITIMDSAKFPLRKWCSNSALLRNKIGEGHEDPLFVLEIGDEDTIKSLGLCWKPVADKFRFGLVSRPQRNKLTKRVILSDLNRIFDPLGFLTPVMIRGKIFLQQLWQIKAEWDSVLPKDIQDKWYIFYSELEELQTLSIPRCAKSNASFVTEIHGFCDASQEAYGACIYVRSRDQSGNWHSRLLCAKSRVAPMKSATIPRLELNGALVLAQLINKVEEAWGIESHRCCLWTDSTVVLSWLNTYSNRLKIYVANRVNQILELTQPSQWKYVRTNENPADLISRGMKTRDIQTSELWWTGPNFLKLEESKWPAPIEIFASSSEALLEQRPIKLALALVTPSNILLEAYLSWNKLLRVTAVWLRFITWVRHRRSANAPKPLVGSLQVKELQFAQDIWVRYAQQQCFADEIKQLSNGNIITKGPLKQLSPYINEGVLRVGGRLTNSKELFSRKHPLLLPRRHRVTELIFQSYHIRFIHIGPQGLLANVRLHFWPLRGRDIARKTVNKCQRCFRAKPIPLQPSMGQLPAARVSVIRPFAQTGVDFAGPFFVQVGLRKSTLVKAYVSVFVCLSTKAVHLELVSDLSADAFMACLRRFISRRGLPSHIWSDNATNFVGARREILSLFAVQHSGRKVYDELVSEGVQLVFIPPGAPHFGGVWKAAVKSLKYHIVRTVVDSKLNFEELCTVLTQIEACLNSRPLTVMSSDPADYTALTPSHFLIDGPAHLIPESNLEDVPNSRLRKWLLLQKLVQNFWQRWKGEYLSSLQGKSKWLKNAAEIKIGSLALLKEDNIPPLSWRLVRIHETHPGKDGVVRVVTVRTSSGNMMKRPLVKVCPLPED